jgi:hypothetical protein
LKALVLKNLAHWSAGQKGGSEEVGKARRQAAAFAAFYGLF